MDARVLIVDDDEGLAVALQGQLARYGFQVSMRHDGEAALAFLEHESADLVVLDIELGGRVDGLAVCRQLRVEQPDLPVILISGVYTDVIDEIVGLEIGADDYLSKPVEPRLLLVRVKSALRRQRKATDPPETLRAADLALYPVERRLTQAGRDVELTRMEFDVLALLMSQPGRIFGRAMIMENIFTGDYDDTRAVDTCISKLRTKLGDDAANPRYIETARGIGYRFLKT